VSDIKNRLEKYRDAQYEPSICDDNYIDGYYDGADAFIPLLVKAYEALEYYVELNHKAGKDIVEHNMVLVPSAIKGIKTTREIDEIIGGKLAESDSKEQECVSK